MQDHPAILAAYINKDEWQGTSVTDELVDRKGKVKLTAIVNWLLRGRGPMATTGCDHGALVNTRGDFYPVFSGEQGKHKQWRLYSLDIDPF